MEIMNEWLNEIIREGINDRTGKPGNEWIKIWMEEMNERRTNLTANQ